MSACLSNLSAHVRPAELLRHVVDAVASAAPDLCVDGAAMVVGVTEPAGGEQPVWTVATIASDVHIVEWLVGFNAPAEWNAIVIVAGGTGHRLEGDFEPLGVRVVLGFDRAGNHSAIVESSDSPELLVRCDEHPEGRLPDCAQRALGLRTAPISVSSSSWFDALWLDRIMARIVGGDVTSWDEIVSLHPAAERGLLAGRSVAAIRAAGAVLARHCSWTDLRRTILAGHEPDTTIGGADAEWMDSSMLGRWLLAELPEADELMAELDLLLPAHLVERLREVREP